MNTLAKFFFLFLLLFIINPEFLFSQQGHWVQTSGPSGTKSQFGASTQLLISRTGNIFSIGDNFSITTDEGKNWTDIHPADSFLFHGLFTLDSSDAFVFLSLEAITRGTNNGSEWDSLSQLPPHSEISNIQTTPSGDLIASEQGGMIYSTDRGITWAKIMIPNSNFFNYGSFSFDTTGGIYTFTDVEWFRSTDKGKSWGGWVPFPQYPGFISSMAITKRNEIYLSTNYIREKKNIYYSPDLGKTWAIANDNLDSASILELFAAPNGDVSGIIKRGKGSFSASNGLVIRPYNSKHWYNNNAGLLHTDNLTTIVYSSDGTAYLATNGDGVWKYEGTFNTVNKQEEDVFSMSVFPNPSFSSFININYYLAESSSPLIRIYSTAGTCVKELLIRNAPAGDNGVPIDMSILPAGAYFINMQVNGGIRRVIVELMK